MDQSIYELLKTIQRRPEMWTGEHTLKSIHSFLSGYQCAILEHKIKDNFGLTIDFHDWVAQQLGFGETTAGWANMILAVTLGLDPKHIIWDNYDSNVTKEEHENSVKLFFELLHTYNTEIIKHKL